MKENPVLCSALHARELQNILVGILDEPSAEIRHMILSHQLEYNHDFAEFVQEMLDTLDGTAFEKQAREKDIQNIVDQMMEWVALFIWLIYISLPSGVSMQLHWLWIQ